MVCVRENGCQSIPLLLEPQSKSPRAPPFWGEGGGLTGLEPR